MQRSVSNGEWSYAPPSSSSVRYKSRVSNGNSFLSKSAMRCANRCDSNRMLANCDHENLPDQE